ncbi:MAG TPA: DUF1634 domain-containing protein [Bryobacteraceae bacterium]|nr:DUF1634 domain-containing protein [Bryobacteraceae bacterium]
MSADERLDVVVSVVLRVGVTLAAVLVAAGGILYLAGHAHDAPDHRVFRGAPQGLTHLGGIFTGVLSLDPLFVIQLGLVILIATPVARVVVCAGAFGLERDWVYTVVSLLVLGLLLFSIAANAI